MSKATSTRIIRRHEKRIRDELFSKFTLSGVIAPRSHLSGDLDVVHEFAEKLYAFTSEAVELYKHGDDVVEVTIAIEPGGVSRIELLARWQRTDFEASNYKDLEDSDG